MTSPWTPSVALPVPFEPRKQGQHWYVEADGREVRLSNLDKIWWPERGYTKGDCIAAYNSLAPYLLPYLRDRPLTLWRMPDGAGTDGFFEKQAPSHTPDWMPRAYIEGHGSRGAIDFLMAQDTASLLYVVNLGCIEMHPMHSRQTTFDRPDYAFFDLDPFPPIDFSTVRRVAVMVNVALERLGLKGYAKISGATGIVVYVPLDGSHTYEEARAFVERICRVINKTWPDGTTMEWDISKRGGKVFLDFGMVREGANIASVYSMRPTPSATIGMPVTWEELAETDVRPEDFTIETAWERLARVGDLFAPMQAAGTPQGHNLSEAMEALGIDRARLHPGNGPAPPPPEPLAEYKRKRSFDITSEPEGALGHGGDSTFMIHKHHARRLHYDVRLERGGVLVSFAVPKGLPAEPNVRHLAVHVEDHPIEYATFEGTIPEGEYGAGEVRIYDSGTYEALEWLEERKLTIRFHGGRVQGEYHFVHTKGKDWIVFRSAREAPAPRLPMPSLSTPPMLATSTDEPFDDDRWVFEVKWDGVRTLAFIDNGEVKLRSRRGRDVTDMYPELSNLAVQLSGRNAVLDGEIVAMEGSRPSFERIQQRFTLSKPNAQVLRDVPVDYLVFDLLWLDGESLMEQPLRERRTLLERNFVPGSRVQISPQIPTKGIAFFEAAKAQSLEGVVAKRADSVYRPGQRTKDWLKIKAIKEQDCVVVGWQPGQGGRAGSIGSLVLALWDEDGPRYCGNVGTGFTNRTLSMLAEVLTPLRTDEPPIAVPPRDDIDLREVVWLRPEMVCTVSYLELTSAGRMRAASFKGLRPDKAPQDAVLGT